jgi:hypothetical protein
VLSSEERQKLLETKQSQIRQIVGKQQFVEQCDTYIVLLISFNIWHGKVLLNIVKQFLFPALLTHNEVYFTYIS